MTDKLCQDCKWCEFKTIGFIFPKKIYHSYAKCLHPSSGAPGYKSVVNGKFSGAIPEFCTVMRLGSSLCETEAKLWEAK